MGTKLQDAPLDKVFRKRRGGLGGGENPQTIPLRSKDGRYLVIQKGFFLPPVFIYLLLPIFPRQIRKALHQ